MTEDDKTLRQILASIEADLPAGQAAIARDLINQVMPDPSAPNSINVGLAIGAIISAIARLDTVLSSVVGYNLGPRETEVE